MKRHLSLLLSVLIAFNVNSAFAVGKIQNEDVKSETDLTNAGGTKAQLINDTKVYVTANGLNDRLDTLITAGQIGGGGGGGIQYLSNPEFETGTAATGWTITTATGANELTTIYKGLHSEKLTFSSQTGGIKQSVTPTVNTASVNMEASCKVLTTMTTVQVCPMTGGTDGVCSSVPASGTWQTVATNFVGPSNGTSVGVDVKVSGSSTGTFYVDDCYVGPARNLSQVSQAQFTGSIKWAPTTSCTWSKSTSIGSLTAVPACAANARTILGSVTDPSSGQRPAVGIPNAGPGHYVFRVVGDLQKNNNANDACYYRFSDGTNFSAQGTMANNVGEVRTPMFEGSIDYATAPGSLTVDFQVGSASGGNCIINADAPTSGIGGLEIEVKYYPNQGQIATNPGATPINWAGYSIATYNFANTGLAAGDATSITGTNTFTTTSSGGGMTCSATASQAGVTCTGLPVGSYLVCPTVGFNTSSVSQGNVIATLTDGSNNTIIDPNFTSVATNNGSIMNNFGCGIYNQTSAGSASFKIRAGYNGGTTALRAQTGTTYSIGFSIANITQGLNAPILVGSVTSNSLGMERVERVTFGGASNPSSCTSTPCTIYTQSGSWITSITRSSQGNYVANIAPGIFSASPTCVGASLAGNQFFQNNATATTTTISIGSFNPSTAYQDNTLAIICMGPR